MLWNEEKTKVPVLMFAIFLDQTGGVWVAAVAIALLAMFSVCFRRTAEQAVQSKHDTKHLFGVIPTTLGILGGGLIFTLGLSFFISAITAPAHPFR